MMVTRQQIVDAQHPRCSWEPDALTKAIEARFPGGADVDLSALIDAWLADGTLPKATQIQCAILAARLAGVRAKHAVREPKATLERIRDEL